MAFRLTARNLVIVVAALVATLVGLSLIIWRGDILEAMLDPRTPYQTYRPPAQPNYDQPQAWALRGATAERGRLQAADVFFVHPTIYDGGRNWNQPIGEPHADEFLQRVVLPNYAGPFARLGRMFAPRYRSASLFTLLNVKDDARAARAFAYDDVDRAFRWFIAHERGDRPIVIVGVEQGGQLAERLIQDVVARDPAISRRFVAGYLIDTGAPADEFGSEAPIPACRNAEQTHCVVAFRQVWADQSGGDTRLLDRTFVWSGQGDLVGLGGRRLICVNPILGGVGEMRAQRRLNRGAANATGVEWGVRPAFLPRESSAQCKGGLLHVSRPRATSLRPSGSWADRLKEPDFNLFYEDLEVDSERRLAAWLQVTAASQASH